MTKKLVVATIIISLAAILAALTLTRNSSWNLFTFRPLSTPSPAPSASPKSQLPIQTDSDIAGWKLVQTLIPQSANSSQMSLSQAYWQLLQAWKVFQKNGLVGLPQTESSLPSQAAIPQAATIKNLIIKLTDKPQASLNTQTDQKAVVFSVGQQFDQGSGNLTILIQLSPTLLSSSPAYLDNANIKTTSLYLAKLYQLTHLNISDKQAEKVAGVTLVEQLNSQPLFKITKAN